MGWTAYSCQLHSSSQKHLLGSNDAGKFRDFLDKPFGHTLWTRSRAKKNLFWVGPSRSIPRSEILLNMKVAFFRVKDQPVTVCWFLFCSVLIFVKELLFNKGRFTISVLYNKLRFKINILDKWYFSSKNFLKTPWPHPLLGASREGLRLPVTSTLHPAVSSLQGQRGPSLPFSCCASSVLKYVMS